MSAQPNSVTITILDKEYMVSCPEEEREDLLQSAQYLDQRMKETRDNGKVLGTERMAVMTALNIVNELLRQQREKRASRANRQRLRALVTFKDRSSTQSTPFGRRGRLKVSPPVVFVSRFSYPLSLTSYPREPSCDVVVQVRIWRAESLIRRKRVPSEPNWFKGQGLQRHPRRAFFVRFVA